MKLGAMDNWYSFVVPNLPTCTHGWKYWLVIDNRYYITCVSVIDYRRLFAFNFLLSIIAFSMLFAYMLSIGGIFFFTYFLAESA